MKIIVAKNMLKNFNLEPFFAMKISSSIYYKDIKVNNSFKIYKSQSQRDIYWRMNQIYLVKNIKCYSEMATREVYTQNKIPLVSYYSTVWITIQLNLVFPIKDGREPPQPHISTKFDKTFSTAKEMIVLYSNGVVLVKIKNG